MYINICTYKYAWPKYFFFGFPIFLLEIIRACNWIFYKEFLVKVKNIYEILQNIKEIIIPALFYSSTLSFVKK